MKKRNVLLGITGGIAAYKALELIRLLVKDRCDVRCILTNNATQFVTPLSVEALSLNPVAIDQFAPRSAPGIQHIELALWPSVVVVAPATANFLGKLACGLADDLLSTTMLALEPTVPVVLAPAMNTRMWNHPAVKRNMKTLASDLRKRLHVAGPVSGDLACRERGVGAMESPQAIADMVARLLD